MSVFLLIKIMISAFTMSFYSYKRVNDKALIIISGLLYSACGYTIQYYTNIMFLDTKIHIFSKRVYGHIGSSVWTVTCSQILYAIRYTMTQF